jgi:hypothetical protein
MTSYRDPPPMNTNPPDVASILQAAQKLGLEDHVKGWGCASPCDTDFVAKTLGTKWDQKLSGSRSVVCKALGRRPADRSISQGGRGGGFAS